MMNKSEHKVVEASKVSTRKRLGLAIPVVLDDGWMAQVVVPRDMSRSEMLRLRRVLWTLAVPWEK